MKKKCFKQLLGLCLMSMVLMVFIMPSLAIASTASTDAVINPLIESPNAERVAEILADDTIGRDNAWMIDKATNQIVEFVEPGKEYSVNFFIYFDGREDYGLDYSSLYFVCETDTGTACEHYVFPDAKKPSNLGFRLKSMFTLQRNFDWHPCVAPGTEATKLIIRQDEMRITPVSGDASWIFQFPSENESFVSIIRPNSQPENVALDISRGFFSGDRISIINDGPGENLYDGKSQGVVVSLDFYTENKTYPSPVKLIDWCDVSFLISDECEVTQCTQYYDYTCPVYRYRFLDTPSIFRDATTKILDVLGDDATEADIERVLREGEPRSGDYAETDYTSTHLPSQPRINALKDNPLFGDEATSCAWIVDAESIDRPVVQELDVDHEYEIHIYLHTEGGDFSGLLMEEGEFFALLEGYSVNHYCFSGSDSRKLYIYHKDTGQIPVITPTVYFTVREDISIKMMVPKDSIRICRMDGSEIARIEGAAWEDFSRNGGVLIGDQALDGTLHAGRENAIQIVIPFSTYTIDQQQDASTLLTDWDNESSTLTESTESVLSSEDDTNTELSVLVAENRNRINSLLWLIVPLFILIVITLGITFMVAHGARDTSETLAIANTNIDELAKTINDYGNDIGDNTDEIAKIRDELNTLKREQAKKTNQ